MAKTTDVQDHPEPDGLGRRRCRKCREFTARRRPDGTPCHAWCEQPRNGQVAAYMDFIAHPARKESTAA